MGKPTNLPMKTAQIMGRKTFTASPCFCGCTEFYASNGGCVECAKARSRARYATPEGKRAQREGDKQRYRVRTGKS